MVNLTVNPLRFTLLEVLDHRRDPGLVRDLSLFEQPNGVALLLDPGKKNQWQSQVTCWIDMSVQRLRMKYLRGVKKIFAALAALGAQSWCQLSEHLGAWSTLKIHTLVCIEVLFLLE